MPIRSRTAVIPRHTDVSTSYSIPFHPPLYSLCSIYVYINIYIYIDIYIPLDSLRASTILRPSYLSGIAYAIFFFSFRTEENSPVVIGLQASTKLQLQTYRFYYFVSELYPDNFVRVTTFLLLFGKVCDVVMR